jgi:hypothetical protein
MGVRVGSFGRRGRLAIAIAGAIGALLLGGGCQIVSLVGMMAETYKETGTKEIKAEYTGLTGKSFAVIVAADRILMAEHPRLQSEVTTIVSMRLREHSGATGFVPPESLMKFQVDTPRWKAMSAKDLAEELGVERLVYVELTDFRLREAGNAYLWSGRASANVSVLEADGSIDDEFIFRKSVAVDFPDQDGFTPEDYSAEYVTTRLRTRLCDRIVWLFHDHEEPYYPDY